MTVLTCGPNKVVFREKKLKERGHILSTKSNMFSVSVGLLQGCPLSLTLRFSGHVQLVEGPGVIPEHSGEIMYLIWPRLTLDKRVKMDGWMGPTEVAYIASVTNARQGCI